MKISHFYICTPGLQTKEKSIYLDIYFHFYIFFVIVVSIVVVVGVFDNILKRMLVHITKYTQIRTHITILLHTDIKFYKMQILVNICKPESTTTEQTNQQKMKNKKEK